MLKISVIEQICDADNFMAKHLRKIYTLEEMIQYFTDSTVTETIYTRRNDDGIYCK